MSIFHSFLIKLFAPENEWSLTYQGKQRQFSTRLLTTIGLEQMMCDDLKSCVESIAKIEFKKSTEETKLQYCRGCLVLWRLSSVLRGMFSTLEGIQYCGDYHQYCGGTPFSVEGNHNHYEYYFKARQCTHVIPQSTGDIPLQKGKRITSWSRCSIN